LWFWKLLNTAHGLEMVRLLNIQAGRSLDQLFAGGQAAAEEMRQWCAGRIRLWSSVTGVTTWVEARKALSAIVWPESFPWEATAEAVWKAALSDQLSQCNSLRIKS
jgi:hypothetical protein